MEKSWIIRPFMGGDETGIFDLWNAVYRARKHEQQDWLRWWRWIYKNNPAGRGKIWVAESEGKIVGQRALIPMELLSGNRCLRAIQSIDVMTHPDYRQLGISGRLATNAMEELKREDHIMIAFPTDAAYRVRRKLPGFCLGRMRLLFKPFNWQKAIRLRTRNRVLSAILGTTASIVFRHVVLKTNRARTMRGLEVREVRSFDTAVNKLLDKTRRQHVIMVARNARYLNWRYGIPGRTYSILLAYAGEELLGYLVLQQKILDDVNMWYILDLIADTEEIMHILVSQAVEKCQLNGADVVMYAFIANEAYHRVFKKNGFVSLPFVGGPRFCVSCHSRCISEHLLRDRNSWLVQMGDSDMN